MRLSVLGLVALISACAHSPTYAPDDPLEPVNRAVYRFNETVDRHVARPVAQGYANVVPAEVRASISRFFDNLTYPVVIVNDALQLKFVQAARDSGRFLLNTTFGLAGLLDPATMVGLPRQREDLGQTFGYWGIGQGWYLMLPLLGPTTNRDLLGRVGDAWVTPLTYFDAEARLPLAGLELVDDRAQLLGTERILEQQFDRYVFVRSAYLQRRRSLVHDGKPPREDEDWE